MIRYTDYTFLWPPRPTKAIPHNFIKIYQRMGWWGQYKKNGTCTMVFVNHDDGEVIYKTRHDTDHKAWSQAHSEASKWFENLPGEGWSVFECELLHSKGFGLRDTFYIFDILVDNGDYLVGKSFAERQEILKNRFLTGDEEVEYSHWKIRDDIWLAKLVDMDNLPEIWKTVKAEADKEDGAFQDEGVVLKNPKAGLRICGKETANNDWMVKLRVGGKNYGF